MCLGGYDPKLNQVVICQNRAWAKGIIQGILAHEFLHMFDYCRAEVDFTNLEHIACSEVAVYWDNIQILRVINFADKSRQFVPLLNDEFNDVGHNQALERR